jgi:hypothetical protein
MTFDWQIVATIAIVAIAALWVVRAVWPSGRRGSQSCGGCSSCPAASKESPTPEKGFVDLDDFRQSVGPIERRNH